MKRKSSNEISPRKRLFGTFPLFGREQASVETPVSTPHYRVRVVRSCELHRSRSLLALGNCSRYCTNSCRLADSRDADCSPDGAQRNPGSSRDTGEDMNG